jgi:hypothetical protein
VIIKNSCVKYPPFFLVNCQYFAKIRKEKRQYFCRTCRVYFWIIFVLFEKNYYSLWMPNKFVISTPLLLAYFTTSDLQLKTTSACRMWLKSSWGEIMSVAQLSPACSVCLSIYSCIDVLAPIDTKIVKLMLWENKL